MCQVDTRTVVCMLACTRLLCCCILAKALLHEHACDHMPAAVQATEHSNIHSLVV